MKHIGMFLFLMLILSFTGLKAQQNVAVTVIFQKNLCRSYYNESQLPIKIEFQVYGLSDQAAQLFITKALKNDGVISSTVSTNTQQGKRIGKLEFFAQADFDYIKNIFVEGGVAFVHVEDLIYSIENWKPFTNEQCTKIFQLNTQIINIETKLNYVMQDPYQRSMAEENGWFMEANDLFTKAKESKKSYVETIK